MKTKEEVIKEAWNNKELNFKDGWLYIGYCCNGWDDVSEYLKDIEISIDRDNYNLDFYDHDNGDWGSVSVRPISLQGVEDNNGWIRIESEEDLPKDFCSCWVQVDGVIINVTLYYHPINKTFTDNMITQNYNHFSHYQPIIKPKTPLY